MNCEEFEQSFISHGLPLDGEQERHVADCPNCAALVRNADRLAAGLRLLAQEWRRVSAPPYVETKLLAAFRNQAQARARRPARIWASRWMWASAAAATVAGALFLILGREPSAPRESPPGSVVQFAAVGGGVSDWIWSDAEGFIPLPNVPDLPSAEPVNIVRVELPRSSIMAWGYWMNDPEGSEKVEADVLLGADGVARAVRVIEDE